MLSNFKSWLVSGQDDSSTSSNIENEEIKTTEKTESNEQTLLQPEDQQTESISKAFNVAKNYGVNLFNLSKQTVKTISSSAAETLKTQLTIPEAPVSILSEFSKEQSKFIQEKYVSKKYQDCSLPWEDTEDEDSREHIRCQVLNLSCDERNFLRNPPIGANFDFNIQVYSVVAKRLLEEDAQLKDLRFKLVPKKIKEEIFWRNYFYRISLLKQSIHLQNSNNTSNNSSNAVATSPGNTMDADNCSKNSSNCSGEYDRLSDLDEALSVNQGKDAASSVAAGGTVTTVSSGVVEEFASDDVAKSGTAYSSKSDAHKNNIKSTGSTKTLASSTIKHNNEEEGDEEDDAEWEAQLSKELENVQDNELDALDNELEAEILAEIQES